MTLRKFDRDYWTFDEAFNYALKVERTERGLTEERLQLDNRAPWRPHPDPEEELQREVMEHLIVALREGHLTAIGRYSDGYTHGPSGGAINENWGLHSSDERHIAPVQWQKGQRMHDTLTGPGWQFIEIRLPRLTMKAIWPQVLPVCPKHADAGPDSASYSTPYLDLMLAAIKLFELSANKQEKKEVLADWFVGKMADEIPVSRNLADSMATLVRLPEAQRGGAKRTTAPPSLRVD